MFCFIILLTMLHHHGRHQHRVLVQQEADFTWSKEQGFMSCFVIQTVDFQHQRCQIL